ncbi:MAG: dynamin family protein [Acidobacteria bacterium]|nr:dynamin family protein [Acidobacteriota bacterium]MBV9477384.1 dynamin family protein [Acidobacteriota bacterium]
MFAQQQQEQIRAATLDIFHRYMRARSELVKNTNVSDPLSENDLKFLANDIRKLAEGRYLLVVVGEAKAGKSTFLNALLRQRVLPSDILQCTSGVIEIVDTAYQPGRPPVFLSVRYGTMPEARLEFESGRAEDLGPMRDRLEAIAAVREEYRDLPIFQLNEYLLTEQPEAITDEIVAELLERRDENGEALLESPHRLPKAKFVALVRHYLDEYRDLQRIPVQVTVGYPLRFGYSDLHIVDTPGVNARGGLDEATIKYIVDADAVVLLHRADNIASRSLEHFFKHKVPQKPKQNAFLFLTHAWSLTAAQRTTLVHETHSLYPESEIRRGRILAIDSLLKIIANRIDAGEKVEALRRDEEIKRLLAYYIQEEAEQREKGRSPDTATTIRQALARDSNFDAAEALLREFSSKAFASFVGSILTHIADAYHEHRRIYGERIHLRRSQVTRPPEDFEEEIEQLKEILKRYQDALASFGTQDLDAFTGLGETQVAFSALAKRYDKALSDAASIDEMKKLLVDFSNESDGLLKQRVAALREAYERKMRELGQTFESKYSVHLPTISMEAITRDAEDRAYEYIKVKGDRKPRAAVGGIIGALLGGIGGFLVGGPPGAVLGAALLGGAQAAKEFFDGAPDRQQKIRNERKHFEEFRQLSQLAVQKLSDDMTEAVSLTASGYRADFNSRMALVVAERSSAYDRLLNERQEAEVLREEIRFLEGQEQTTAKERGTIDELTAVL